MEKIDSLKFKDRIIISLFLLMIAVFISAFSYYKIIEFSPSDSVLDEIMNLVNLSEDMAAKIWILFLIFGISFLWLTLTETINLIFLTVEIYYDNNSKTFLKFSKSLISRKKLYLSENEIEGVYIYKRAGHSTIITDSYVKIHGKVIKLGLGGMKLVSLFSEFFDLDPIHVKRDPLKEIVPRVSNTLNSDSHDI